MISKLVNKYCSEDPSLIENYDKAISDTTQIWHCHHRLETELNLSNKQLNEMNLYLNRPAKELIFLTRADHASLHNKGKQYSIPKSAETRKKMSIANKGRFKGEKNPAFGRTGEKHPMFGKPGVNIGKHRVYENPEHTKWHYE